MDVAFVEVQPANAHIRKDKARWVSERLGNTDSFFTTGDPLGKFAQLGKAIDQAGTGGNRGRGTEGWKEQLSFGAGHVSPHQLYGLTIVTQEVVDMAQDVMRHDLEEAIPKGLGDGQGALAGHNRAVIVPHHPEIPAHIDTDLPQPPLVLQRLGQGFGFPQVGKDPLVFCQLHQCNAQVEPEIDSLLAPVAALREVPKGHQRLLKGGCRLAEGGARHRPGASLAAVGQRLVPHLTPHGVVRQAFDLLGPALGGERLQGCNNAGV